MKATDRKLPSLPIPIDRQLDIEISAALNGIVGSEETGFAMFEDRRPSPVVLGRLKDRLKATIMAPAANYPQELVLELSRAFASMPGQSANPELQARVYIEELSDLPAAMISTVLRRYIRGEIGNERFIPTIADIRRSVLKMTDPIDRERDRIVKVLEFWGTENANGRPVTLIPAKEGQGASRRADGGNDGTGGSDAPGGSGQAEDRS